MSAEALFQVLGTVENGGFISFLWLDHEDEEDGSIRMLEEAIAGAEQIGAHAHAAVLRDFSRVGPASATGAEVRRREAAGEELPLEIDEMLAELDRRLFELPPLDAHEAPLEPPPRLPSEAELWARCPDLDDPDAAVRDLAREIRADDPALERWIRGYCLTLLSNAGDGTVPFADLRAGALAAARRSA